MYLKYSDDNPVMYRITDDGLIRLLSFYSSRSYDLSWDTLIDEMEHINRNGKKTILWSECSILTEDEFFLECI